jgi:tetratricopeptide (TPR) repeat protein
MNEQRLLAYASLIQELLNCPSGEENQILSQHPELIDGAFVQVCEQLAEQLQSHGQENNAGFLRNLAQEVGAFLARLGTGGNQQELLKKFWQQLLKAEMESGGNEVAVHQVMRQNMGLIVPNLGDTIVQWMQEVVTQYPDQAEGVAGLIEDTCTSIQQFPYGRYAEALEIAIRGYGVVLELGVYTPEGRAQTLNNLGNARLTQAEMGINPAANLDSAIAAYDEAAEIIRRLGLARDLATTLNNFGFAYQAQSHLAGNSSTQTQQALENAYRSFQEALERVEYLRGEIIGADSEGYKRNFNEEWNKVYRGMVEVCLELGRYQDAIEYVDRSKARNLVELIATRDVYPKGIIPKEIRQRLQYLGNTIAEEDRRLKQNPNPDYTHINQMRE